jgi:hypothetical protein
MELLTLKKQLSRSLSLQINDNPTIKGQELVLDQDTTSAEDVDSETFTYSIVT